MVDIRRKDLDEVLKDRLDFGFDSIYFRYAEAIIELSFFKDMEARRMGRDFDRKFWVDNKLMHFYNCLEQLTHAHENKEEIVYKFKNNEYIKVFQEFAKTAQEVTGGF